jgi:hypothetical protein
MKVKPAPLGRLTGSETRSHTAQAPAAII